jgi:hypothetical protein
VPVSVLAAESKYSEVAGGCVLFLPFDGSVAYNHLGGVRDAIDIGNIWMSYDLAVFDPRKELRERSAFLKWYHERTSWSDGLDYFDPGNATPAMQAWYRDLISTFPPLNGPDRPANIELCAADYGISHLLRLSQS